MDNYIAGHLIDALGPIIAVIIGTILNLNVSRKIHILVNGQRTMMAKQLETLKADIEKLENELKTVVSAKVSDFVDVSLKGILPDKE